MIYIGTSGYSYQDWKGPVYPEDIKDTDMLPFYSQLFNTTEINYTYYRMPAARTLAAMASKVPDNFVFTIKASKELTHEREAEDGGGTPENFRLFRQALQPLIDEGKFGAVLAQFPNSFKPTPENRDYLSVFRERMGDLPVVVEFRNAPGSPTNDGAAAEEQPGLLLRGRAAHEGPDPAHSGGYSAYRLRALPRPQRQEVVAARRGLRALQLRIQARRAAGVGSQDREA